MGLFIIDRLYQSDEVQAQLEQVLPPRLAPLAKPAAAGLKQVAQRNAGRVLGTDAALQAWETRQPDSARDAASHHQERRRRGGRVARAEGPVRADGCGHRPSPRDAVDKLPPEVSSLQVAGPGQLEGGPRPARHVQDASLGAARPVGRGVRGGDRAVARPAPDRADGGRLPDLRRHRPARDPPARRLLRRRRARRRAERSRDRRQRLGHRDVAARGRRRGRQCCSGCSWSSAPGCRARDGARRRSGAARRTRCASTRASSARSLAAGILLLVHLGPGAVDAEDMGHRDLHRPRLPVARVGPTADPRAVPRRGRRRACHDEFDGSPEWKRSAPFS